MANCSVTSASLKAWNCSKPWAAYSTGHIPSGDAPLERGAMMLRRPSQRFLSAPKHGHCTPDELRAPPFEQLDEALTARWPGKQGCMTKMLTGVHCSAPLHTGEALAAVSIFRRLAEAEGLTLRKESTHDPSLCIGLHGCYAYNASSPAVQVLDDYVAREAQRLAGRLPEAVANLHRLAFVGLTEMWDLSVALFHARLQPGVAPVPAELLNNHPSDSFKSTASEGVARVYDESVLRGFWDDAEERLYAEAERRFQREASEFLSAGSATRIDDFHAALPNVGSVLPVQRDQLLREPHADDAYRGC